MTLSDSTIDLLALWLIPGIGPQRFQQILAEYDPIESVFDESQRALRQKTNFSDTICRSIITARDADVLKRELELVDKFGLRIITQSQDNYPVLLREVYNAPPVLYTKGAADLNTGLSIAFVGSRKASYYGKAMCRKLVKQLARISSNIKIISGLAIGIDKEAHTAALDNGLQTIAVLAGGLSEIYPAKHHELADRICDNGMIMTEFPITSKPVAMNFPLRNRIISGMSKGTVVIEAGERSGASITAGYAIEQNKELFALPGPADSSYHIGTNRLIQKGSAKLILTADDILDELNPQLEWRDVQVGKDGDDNSREDKTTQIEGRIINVLRKGEIGQEELASKLGIPIQDVLSNLTLLELKEIVICKPGRVYQLASSV